MPFTKSILLVDEDANLRRTTVTILEQAGYTVENKARGCDALVSLKAKPYDMVVLSLSHPEYGIQTLLENIRLIAPNIPIVILTGSSANESQIATQVSGAVEFILKPIDPSIILERIQQLLKDA
jgi:DNA-binding response OmpR family regulator